MKISITMNDELMATVDEIAKSNYMTRSGFIAFACRNYITQMQVVDKLKSLNEIMTKLYDKGMLDEEDTRNLQSLIKALPQ